jgi:hypothetical protein
MACSVAHVILSNSNENVILDVTVLVFGPKSQEIGQLSDHTSGALFPDREQSSIVEGRKAIRTLSSGTVP